MQAGTVLRRRVHVGLVVAALSAIVHSGLAVAGGRGECSPKSWPFGKEGREDRGTASCGISLSNPWFLIITTLAVAAL